MAIPQQHESAVVGTALGDIQAFMAHADELAIAEMPALIWASTTIPHLDTRAVGGVAAADIQAFAANPDDRLSDEGPPLVWVSNAAGPDLDIGAVDRAAARDIQALSANAPDFHGVTRLVETGRQHANNRE
jgi:hypothetical protein